MLQKPCIQVIQEEFQDFSDLRVIIQEQNRRIQALSRMDLVSSTLPR